ncbi:MAG: AAA family ATPase [Bacteroidales bacterium]|nr:AAA family ATPase [Bacteroidales bacterium]
MKPYEYPNEKIPGEIIERFKDFWGSFQFELAGNPNLVKECRIILSNRRRARKTDLRKYLTLFNNTVYPINNKASKKRQGGFGREFGMLVNSRNGELYMLNYRQFYRLMLVFLIWRALTESDKFAMKGARLNDALNDTSNPRNAAMLYLVYKFISIAETYQGFCNAYYLTEEKFTPLIREWPNRDALGTIKQDLELIMRTDDYRTLKFKQTVNYLRQGKDYYGAEVSNLQGINYGYFLSFDNMNNQMKGISLKEIQWRLPCPIFEGDIILNDGKDNYPLDTLSSGMIQRLNTVGSLVYHLRNLDDDQEGEGMVAYEQVCVVLEEVELYYHPEYQKSYLNYLLEQISRSGISRLKSVNLVFVTHSPFILSDITKNDILCLENGKQAEVELKTFGANIHDLLRHPFFMKKGTIGDFAQKVINEIIVSLSIYDAIRKSGNRLFDIRRFKEDNPELVESMGFLPLEVDGNLSMMDFEVQYSQRTIMEAISLLDEPIIKDALQREYKRIFS